MASQLQALGYVVNTAPGRRFVTVAGKLAVLPLAAAVANAERLLEPNDPLAFVAAELEADADAPTATAVCTLAPAVFRGLPHLAALLPKPVVIHAVVSAGDVSPITLLRDLGVPIVVLYSARETQDLAAAAHVYAQTSGKLVLHFIVPSDDSVALVKGELLQQYLAATPEDAASVLGAKSVSGALLAPATVLVNVRLATEAVVVLGQPPAGFAETLKLLKVSVVRINTYQPFPHAALLLELPPLVTRVVAVEVTGSAHQHFAPLLLDVVQHTQALSDRKILLVVAATVLPKADGAVAASSLLAAAKLSLQNVHVGPTAGAAKVSKAGAARAANVASLEEAYLQMLRHTVSADTLQILNASDKLTVGTSPEYGFGKYLREEELRSELLARVQHVVAHPESLNTPEKFELARRLSQWLVTGEGVTQINWLLNTDSLAAGRGLVELSHLFTPKLLWLVGSDLWAYDLGALGVHHVITLGKKVRMLVVELEPQLTKSAFRKKDIGLYAMNSGACYVALVAVYASYTQVLQALAEAEQFDGPAVVLAYLPYNSELDDTLAVLQETKRAVDSGYWPLYRYNPTLADPSAQFKLDLSLLRNELKSFLERENQLSLLAARDPQLARNLEQGLQAHRVKQAQEARAKEAYALLLAGLSGPPVTVAFASDGGQAEGVARRIGRQASARGLKATVVSMDLLVDEDLSQIENIVFVTSTGGQGEFPQNGKALWDALRGLLDYDLATSKVTVFGMGDLQYWPRAQDAHYYNKPAKDLWARLELFGAQQLAPLGLGDDQDADGFKTGLEAWLPQLWEGLGVGGVAGAEEPKPITNEDMKLGLDFLRGTIVEGLQDELTGAICAVDQQLTKFHGIYMQDDRDIRDQRKAQGLEPAYSFMVRVRLPGGVALPLQYLKMDQLADTRGNGTLKLTTRATFQLHGVVKHDLKPAIRGMNSALMDTLAACGDVNRNVMVLALPHNRKVHRQILEQGTLLLEYLLPTTTSYYEIWLEGNDPTDAKAGVDPQVWETRQEGPRKKKTLVAGDGLVDVEPMYTNLYLPRKFKIVITVPPYNDVDVYAHDIGLIAIVNEQDEVEGYNVLAGGGMGSTHNNKKTYPRLGLMMGYVPASEVHLACEQIMLVQRDFGDRTNRKHARLKYTIDTLGVAEFKQKVEEYWGKKFAPEREFKITLNVDYFGWTKDETGLNHFTCFIENGRIEDTVALPQKTGLAKIGRHMVENSYGNFRLTGNQHLLISDVPDEQLAAVRGLMAEYKLDNTDFSALRLLSAACVAFPTCGLAMAELERYLPQLITKLEAGLEEYGLRHDSVVMRMTGCPNGCARPWVAEVACVGKAAGTYNLMLGGGHHGERLNKIYRYLIKEEEILATLLPMFKLWALERHEGEPFGDFVIRKQWIKPTLEGRFFHDDLPAEA